MAFWFTVGVVWIVIGLFHYFFVIDETRKVLGGTAFFIEFMILCPVMVGQALYNTYIKNKKFSKNK